MGTRVKIKAPNPALYEEVRSMIGNRVRIYVASEKRGILSTDPLPDDLKARIEARGATVTPEVHYTLEAIKAVP
jgi:hypothetical protein